MTTLKKLIEEIDFNNSKLKTTPGWYDLSNTLGILNTINWSDDERLTAYFMRVHYCTDTWVGIKAYFLDGNFVAISNQIGRKHDEEFEFKSLEDALTVKQYLEGLQEPPELQIDIISEDDWNEEIPDCYAIEYNTQVLHKHAILNDEEVAIIKTRLTNDIQHPDYFHSVRIQYQNGKKETVDVRKLKFKYNTLN